MEVKTMAEERLKGDEKVKKISAVREMIKKKENLYLLLQPGSKRKKSFLVRSQMTKTCVACFHERTARWKDIVEGHQFDQDKLLQIRARIQRYSDSMKNFYETSNRAEVGEDQLQRQSFTFFRSVCEEYFPPGVFENFEFYNKWNNKYKTKYRTILIEDDGGLISVIGETDSTLYYCNVPLATWEDTNRTLSLQTSAEVGQALVEVKAFGELFTRTIREIPLIFSGILTSGLVWSLFLRTYGEDDFSYTRTIPISTYDATTKSIIPEKIEEVALLFMRHLSVISHLVSMVDKERKARLLLR
jgi:hypothetical protein